MLVTLSKILFVVYKVRNYIKIIVHCVSCSHQYVFDKSLIEDLKSGDEKDSYCWILKMKEDTVECRYIAESQIVFLFGLSRNLPQASVYIYLCNPIPVFHL